MRKAKSEVGTCLKETVGARALVKREGPDADKLSAKRMTLDVLGGMK